MKIYRLVSQSEYLDILQRKGFYLARNTLEAKEFWLSETACYQFLAQMQRHRLSPPYTKLLLIEVNDGLSNIPHLRMELDGYEALIIDRDALPLFNKIVTFEAVDL